MIRMSRAGRKGAIINAIRKLNSDRRGVGYYRGEICRVMGITSQSKIRDILHEMVQDGILLSGNSAVDGYPEELEIFQIAKYEQRMFPELAAIFEERNERLSKLIGV